MLAPGFAGGRHLRFVQSSALGEEPTWQGQQRCSRRAQPVPYVDSAKFLPRMKDGRHLGGAYRTARTKNTPRSAPLARDRCSFQASTLFRTHFSRCGNRRCSVELGIAREQPRPRAQHASTGAPHLESATASPNKSKAEPPLSPWWSVRAWFPRLRKTKTRGRWEC